MARLSVARSVVASALVASCAGPAFLATPALAQNTVRISSGSSGGRIGSPDQPPVTSKHIDKYASLLGLDADQRTTLNDMFQSFQNEANTASALMQQKIDDARAEAEESGQFESFMKTMMSARETYNTSITQAETRLFDDLRLVLTPDQDQRWPELERTRRRMENLKDGGMSSESVDLVELVDDQSYPDPVMESVGPVLVAYETALDTALTERIDARHQLRDKMAEDRGQGDIMKFRDDYDRIHDASVKVRDVNITFARQVRDSLPTEYRETFEAEFQRRSFPQVYSDTYAERVVDSALDFDDLTDGQRQQIQDLKKRLTAEMDAVNARWADAVRADETSEDTQTIFADQFGMPMQIRLGEESEDLKKAKADRSELASKYLDQVRGLLSPDQQARLPRREPSQRSLGGGARMMVIESVSSDAADSAGHN